MGSAPEHGRHGPFHPGFCARRCSAGSGKNSGLAGAGLLKPIGRDLAAAAEWFAPAPGSAWSVGLGQRRNNASVEAERLSKADCDKGISFCVKQVNRARRQGRRQGTGRQRRRRHVSESSNANRKEGRYTDGSTRGSVETMRLRNRVRRQRPSSNHAVSVKTAGNASENLVQLHPVTLFSFMAGLRWRNCFDRAALRCRPAGGFARRGWGGWPCVGAAPGRRPESTPPTRPARRRGSAPGCAAPGTDQQHTIHRHALASQRAISAPDRSGRPGERRTSKRSCAVGGIDVDRPAPGRGVAALISCLRPAPGCG